jgi:hypothetical protein
VIFRNSASNETLLTTFGQVEFHDQSSNNRDFNGSGGGSEGEPGAVVSFYDESAACNTSDSAIIGSFKRLPDGAEVSIGRNNFQVSYSGGDGNDLTLTVVQ